MGEGGRLKPAPVGVAEPGRLLNPPFFSEDGRGGALTCAGGVGKLDSVNTDASDAARWSCPLAVGTPEERGPGCICGVLGSGELKLVGERNFCWCWGNADGGGPGERLSEGGGASSRFKSRSGLRGERGKGDETAPAVVFERVGVGSVRACICANADCVAGGEMGEMGFGLVGARGRGGSAAGQPPGCCSCGGG